MNDDFLKKMRKPPRREFANELYMRISKPMNEPSHTVEPFVLRRVALATGIVSLVLLLTLMVSPTARAFAQDQIRQIGALIFQPIDRESTSWPIVTAQPTSIAPGDTNPPENATLLEDASRLSGFDVLAPEYLPEGYAVDSVWSIDKRESGIYVVSTFRNDANSQFLLLNQIDYESGANFVQTYADNEQVSDVSVRQQAGVWITGRLMADPTDHRPNSQAEPQLYPTNWLVWEESGITYALFGNGLSQAEMVRIAESLER
jgi:hypothetical protein